MIGLGCLASLALCWPLSYAHFDSAFYLMPPRLWELASGAVLFDWQARAGASLPLEPRCPPISRRGGDDTPWPRLRLH